MSHSNTELRTKLQLIIEEIVMQGATYADSKDGLRDKNYVRAEKKALKELEALYQVTTAASPDNQSHTECCQNATTQEHKRESL